MSPDAETGTGLDVVALGTRIRTLRSAQGLSLDDAAVHCGVSRSMLSAVERGEKIPSVLVVHRIATGLGSNITRLLGEEDAAPVVVLRRATQDVARDPSGWERRNLAPALPGVAFEFMRTTIPAGVYAGEFPPHPPGSREYVAVEQGQLRLTVAGTSYQLETGDSIAYHGTVGTPSPILVPAIVSITSRSKFRLTRCPSTWAHIRSLAVLDSPSMMLDPETFRTLGYQAVDLAVEHLAGMRDAPVFQPMPAAARRSLLEQSLPDVGIAPNEILGLFEAEIVPYPMGNGHPRFFGWVNSPPAPMGILAEFLAAAMGPSCAGGDHAAIYLERSVVRWLMELVHFPVAGSMGMLVSGGSMASLTGLAAARQRAAVRDGWAVRERGLYGWGERLTMYMSTEAHTTLRKAAEMLGLGTESVRVVPVDSDCRMDMDALRDAISADRAVGLRPFCVIGSAGTVSTGAIDPLDEIADLCKQEDLWFHIDGAYGAVGVLDRRVAPQYAGMERADSLALDPHKWLSVPVECGCALVRDASLLRDTFSMVPPYLRTEEGKGFGGLPWFSEYGFQQTRGFRALKLWMTLLHAGRDGLAEMISRHNDLARLLGEFVVESPDMELMADVTLSVCCFRYVPQDRDLDDAALDALNKRIMEAIQAGGAAFLTQAMVQGRFALRANVLHYATTRDDIEALVEVVRETGEALA